MTDQTSIELTDRTITALRTEAATAGDSAQVIICDAALAGDSQAKNSIAEQREWMVS